MKLLETSLSIGPLIIILLVELNLIFKGLVFTAPTQLFVNKNKLTIKNSPRIIIIYCIIYNY